jgi:hypothetical protein
MLNMRIIVRGIVNNETKTLKEMGLEGKKIKRVCTILNEENMYAKFNPHTGEPIEKDLNYLILEHLKTVFFEDKLHDWDIYGNNFKFYAHSSDIGEKVDLLIEFE